MFPAEKLQSVAVVVAGTDGVEAVKAALASSFDASTKITYYETHDIIILPYIVQKVIKESKASYVLAISVSIGEGNSAVNHAVLPALLQVGIASDTPVVPSIIQAASLAELSTQLPVYSKAWSASFASLAAPLKSSPLEAAKEVKVCPKTLNMPLTSPFTLQYSLY